MYLHYPLPEGIRISQRFGENPSWYPTSKGHNGVDWACIVGTRVFAMRGGTVSVARNDGKTGYGRHVRIQHDNGVSIYGHLSEIQCAVGDTVVMGEQIGLSGGATSDPGSGFSTGPHLHAEYRLTDVPNPVPGGYVYNAIDILPLLVGDAWEVQGIDISSWNGVMDLSITKTKVQYAYIRVGYNNYGKDSRCDYNRQQAIANDFPYGVYWYCKPGLDWQQHASNFARIANEYPYQLDMVLDVETTLLNPTDTLAWLKNLDGKLRSLTGKDPIIYTSKGFWDSAVARSTYFSGRKLWVANWTTREYPVIPTDWSRWTHWQWSADGNMKAREYGMVSDGDNDMDLDRFNGSCVEFNTMYGTHIVPIGELPAPPTSQFEMVVTADVLNVRSGPATTYPVVGALYKDNVVELADIDGTNAWMKIKSGPYAGKYAAVKISTSRYMRPK